MTIQYQQPGINLGTADVVFAGQIGATDVPIPGAVVTPLPIQIVTINSYFFSHSAGSSIIKLMTDARVTIQWSVSINVSSGGRKSSTTMLLIDDGGGLNVIPGASGFGYHRNSASGLDTTSGMFISAGTLPSLTEIQIASQRVSGSGSLKFAGSACSIIVSLTPPG